MLPVSFLLTLLAARSSAATGVGRALAVEAARRGAHVIVADVDDAAETVAMIDGDGGSAEAAVCDIRDADAMDALGEAIGDVNVVCANAGGGAGGGIDHLTVDAFREVFELNVFGTFNTVHAFLPALGRIAADGGRAGLLITGSEHSLGVPPYVQPITAYTSSKHALLGFAACLRRDLDGTGVRVSLLCPGWVRTERLRAFDMLAETLANLGQDADEVAQRAFDGFEAGELVVPTSDVMAEFVTATHQEIIDAVRKVPARGARP